MFDWFLVRTECSFTTSVLILRVIHHTSQMVRDPSMGMKWGGHEADHLPSTSSSQEDISCSQDVLLHMKYGVIWASSLFIQKTSNAWLLVQICVYYERWVHAVKNTMISSDYLRRFCLHISLQINPRIITHHNNESPWLYNLMTSHL